MVPLPRGRDAAARATVDPVVKFERKPARRAVGKPAGGLGGFDLSRHGRLHCDCRCQGESVRGDAAADGGWLGDGVDLVGVG